MDHWRIIPTSPTVFARSTIINDFSFISAVSLNRQINTCNMKHSIPLKRFDYAVPFPDTYDDRPGSGDGDPFETHLAPLKVSIDFEKRDLYLEGTDLFEKDVVQIEKDSAQKPQRMASIPGNEGIIVKATFSSGFHINLSEFTKDELVFPMDGILDDGKTLNSCSGLLMIAKTINRDGSETGEYHLNVYLYDDSDNDREIKLRLTMYPLLPNALLN
jgi:hypothetical protein